MGIQKAIMGYVEAELILNQAKKDLLITLVENAPNPFLKIDYAAIKREACNIDPALREYFPRH